MWIPLVTKIGLDTDWFFKYFPEKPEYWICTLHSSLSLLRGCQWAILASVSYTTGPDGVTASSLVFLSGAFRHLEYIGSHLNSEVGKTEASLSSNSSEKKTVHWLYGPVFSFPPQGETTIWEFSPDHVALHWAGGLEGGGEFSLPAWIWLFFFLLFFFTCLGCKRLLRVLWISHKENWCMYCWISVSMGERRVWGFLFPILLASLYPISCCWNVFNHYREIGGIYKENASKKGCASI